MSAWLLFCIFAFLSLHRTISVDITSTVKEIASVWSGVADLFCDRFNQPSGSTNCQGHDDNFESLKSLWKTGLDILDSECSDLFDDNLKVILEAMNNSCPKVDSPVSINIASDICALQNAFLTKNSLLVLSRPLIDKYLNICTEEIDSEVSTTLQKWVISITDTITWAESFSNEDTLTINNDASATYLNSYLEDFAVLSNLTDSVFYSTTMDALSAFAPVIRGSDKIRFLQNIEETMATATYNLLQSNNGGFTFIYDDNDKLFFLIRVIKDIYFNTISLPDHWNESETIKNTLTTRLQASGNPHTYVLLFTEQNSADYTEEFLQIAMMNQQLRSGIQVILLSSQVGCSPYSKYLQTGASLVTFSASNTYAPNVPNPFYQPAWISAALYLDGLTYITLNATQLPGDYILSRINFDETQPTANPIEALAILDCAKDTSEGIGSLVRTRDPPMLVTSVNSTINGRTLRVGVVSYGPFYENGSGFSVPIMTAMAALGSFSYEITYFNLAANDEHYYSQMQRAIAENRIDAGFTPIPSYAAQAENVLGSAAGLTTTFTLLRQSPQRSADFLLILRPLAMPVWIASVILAFIFTGLLMLFGHLRPVIMRNLAEGEISSKMNLFEVSSLGVASSFSFTKLQIIPTTLSSRIFALIMWLFSCLLLILYASAMMTIMLRIRKPINNDVTVDDVLDPNKCDSIILLKHGIDFNQIAVSLNNSQRTFTTVETIQAAYDTLMKSHKTVLIASSIEASYISAMSCELEQIPYTNIFETQLVFPYFKNWQYGSSFNAHLTLISGTDVLNNAASVYFGTGLCYHWPFKTPNPVILELGDSASIYIFLLTGIITAFIILGIELLVKYRNKKKDSTEYVNLKLGRHYPAKIVSIKPSGIHVEVANRPETAFIPNSQLHPNPLKVYNALDLGLSEGDIIEVTYFGKSDRAADTFCRYYPSEGEKENRQ